ncbi:MULTISPECIES: hypothetical protein [Sinorhizobium]|uniref:hypothetical protein n=1 Tax=Sinorhizobium TaxID=28105 RepID=UPI0015969FFA|nr:MULTISPECIES: hypothetical protein [Sinorhizobium]
MADTKTTTVPVKLLYDTWAIDEERIPAGTVLDLPVKAAKILIAQGKAERNDPLPGEEG